MGITYHVQVETWQEPIPKYNMGGRWEALSRWELGKDYGFATDWLEVAHSGWPRGACLIGDEGHELSALNHDGKRWAGGEFLELVAPDEPSVWLLALKAHVSFLIAQGLRVRLLSWEE